ncbi:MAG: Hsp20/alpha crystallin family protein [Candidatus Methanoplasma sp.]|jgi:HSP20 family protein|nr:Hsp20/alpha crystallin family protein [Candidatus Methanoplasma sp.]
MDTDDIWNGLFGGNFEAMARKMEKMFSEMENLRGADVKTYGYTMYRDSDGSRHVKEFGNSVGDREISYGAGEPLTDVSLEDGTIRAIAEIPGVLKEDIVLEGTKSTLSIGVDNGRRKFSKTLALPCDVDPDSAKAEYNNGILEVTLTPIVTPDSKKRISIR